MTLWPSSCPLTSGEDAWPMWETGQNSRDQHPKPPRGLLWPPRPPSLMGLHRWSPPDLPPGQDTLCAPGAPTLSHVPTGFQGNFGLLDF